MKEAKYIWKDGQLVEWKDATVHILTHTLHYGNGVFEGTRAYKNEDGKFAIFRLQDHTRRLMNSCKITALKCPYTQEQLEKAQVELLRANLDVFDGNVYIRPLVYLGYGAMGMDLRKPPVNVAIAAWEWGAYLGEDAINNGIKVKTSSFSRNSVKSTLNKAKAVSNYLNSQMAKYEALECGFEEALMLDEYGFVAEGSAECVFIVRDGVLITPPHDYALESITQDTVVQIAKDMGISVVERRITRDEFYIADEAFFTGTAAEITPIASLDFRNIGNGRVGEMTKALQKRFFDIVQGRDEKFNHFLTYID